MQDKLRKLTSQIEDVKTDLSKTKSETKSSKLKIHLSRLRLDKKEIESELSKTKYEKIVRVYNAYEKSFGELKYKTDLLKSHDSIQPNDIEYRKTKLQETLDKLDKENLQTKTYYLLIVDSSSSMSKLTETTISGVNEQIDSIKDL